MNSIKNNEDLDFLNSYWKKVNDIGFKIKKELPNFNSKIIRTDGRLCFIKYSDLDNWSVDSLMGKSNNLVTLANKISYMISMGNGNSVKPMLEKIVSRGVKSLSHPPTKYGRSIGSTTEFLGKGHFRWDFGAVVLTDKEIKRIKEYFNL